MRKLNNEREILLIYSSIAVEDFLQLSQMVWIMGNATRCRTAGRFIYDDGNIMVVMLGMRSDNRKFIKTMRLNIKFELPFLVIGRELDIPQFEGWSIGYKGIASNLKECLNRSPMFCGLEQCGVDFYSCGVELNELMHLFVTAN